MQTMMVAVAALAAVLGLVVVLVVVGVWWHCRKK
jgi:hypothetical protein